MNHARRVVVVSSLVFGGFMAFSGSAAAQISGHFDRTLKVSGPVTLSVTSGSGSVAVTAGTDASVHVVGTIRGNTRRGKWSDADVERAVRAIEAKPPIVQNGSTIGLGAIEDEEIAQQVSISWEVTVPRRTELTVKTGSGSQKVAALAGPVTATSGSGSITIGAVEAAVDVRTGSGSIDVEGARERVNATSGSGTITLGAVSGKVAINTGSGSISVSKAAEATVDVSTGSGEIEITGLTGGLTANAASGSIHITGTPTADWQLHSSSGSIVLGIPLGTAFRVQANTSSGSIDTDHKLTVTHAGRRELTGAVGAGGVLVSARTSSGSIRIGR
jgi:DUF4097 and DUF4098 domain-containing protein YvlB